jgi:lysophospholipid hydrolase
MSDHLTQIHHGTVARATEDTTLAVIPAEAFRRLTQKFPNASAHIVQGASFLPTKKNRLVTRLFLVIMTRFSRVTFNAAHKYLGLTTEVLRTEKAINDIACHPLPAIFYEGGGMQQLRQRFDGVGTQDLSPSQSEPGGDYYDFSSTVVSSRSCTKSQLSKEASTISPVKLSGGIQFRPRKSRSSRHLVQAGDLHSSTAFGEAYRPLGRSLNAPHLPRRELYETTEFLHLDGVDFDLRQEVMNCIAVSIGLSQPPLSANTSGEASPSFSAAESTASVRISRPVGDLLDSPFGSLSLLDIADDSSSATGASSATASGYMSGLDNEVEILFFSSGSYLAKAGERDIGV